MHSARENDFPATSIGRGSGARFQQAAAAHEAHPLISPSSVSPTSSEQGHGGNIVGGGATLHVNGVPKYVPYTPRQRVTPTAAMTGTTGTTVQPQSPQHHHHGDATSKLQLVHLKAAAQNIGLDSGSLGWSILEKLVSEVDTSEEWTEVWNTITTSKVTLLLPLEAASSREKITADFVKDHVVLCDSPSRNYAQIVTLSGLRGTLTDETLAFRSTLHPTSKLFQDLLNPATRTSTISLLPPLPVPLPDISPAKYPEFSLPSHAASLHLPPRQQQPTKPPLPPRPSSRSAPLNNAASTSRISNPFASLFGTTKAPVSPAASSPPASLHSLDSAQDPSSPIEISAFTIDRRINRTELAKDMNKTVKKELKAALGATISLGSVPVPAWVGERVQDMTTGWYPFVKAPSQPTKKRKTEDGDRTGNDYGYVVNPIEESPEDAAERLQDFYLCLEQDMRAGGTPFIPRRQEPDSDVEDEREREKRESDRMESETRVRLVMEAVERTITSLFYDRLFMQSTADDASHDEALSSRVAALNMLDLGLGHLGIEVGEGVNEVELNVVVKACGDMLTQLDTCRSPGDKSAILVAAHKIVVDGLSRLPPIRLISEHDVDAESIEMHPRTAKPGDVFETESKPQPCPSEPYLSEKNVPGVSQPSAAPAPVSPTAILPPIPSSPEVEPPVPSETNMTTSAKSKTKSPPPPLPLTQPVSEPKTAIPKASSSPKDPTPVSGDVLFPLIIFSVVKANPPHLVSNLLFTQRFRNQSVGGEESYCLINLMAVAEFLENVDMAALGLGDSERVMSTADLTPIPLTRSPVTAETPLAPADGVPGLRGRVEQQVDAIADSANKVISGVVDSSFGILRSFMPTANSPNLSVGNRSRPITPKLDKTGFGLLRKDSGFSIANLAASLPIAGRSRPAGGSEETGQQLITVSRPGSGKASSLRVQAGGDESQDESEDGSSVTDDDDDNSEAENGEGEEAGEASAGTTEARSIRSFENMLSSTKGKATKSIRPRKSLTDRLASVSASAGLKGSPTPSRRSSLLQPAPAANNSHLHSGGSPTSSRPTSPVQLRLAPPKQRFMDCTPDDLRLSEVVELLRDYRRLVEGIRAVSGFEES